MDVANKHGLKGFAEHLVKQSLIDVDSAVKLNEQAEQQKSSFILQLIHDKCLPSSKVAELVADYFDIPLFDLSAYDASHLPQQLNQTELVQKRQALPLHVNNNNLTIAIIDPTLSQLHEINFLTGLQPNFVIVDAEKLHQTIHDHLNTQLASHLGDWEQEALDNITIAEESNTKNFDSDLAKDDAPIVRFINKILFDAIQQKASDIHFEPYEKKYRIRYRIDGVLRDVSNPPLKLSNYLATRLKVISNLDLSERRLPQDGRFKLNLPNMRSIDFRVSSCPTLWGEKIVLRILESSMQQLDINSLGMEEHQKKLFLEKIKLPQGIILVTGPTGSGKTVSLYTAMNILNEVDKNISTVEDPVEINLEGINQVHVNNKTGLTFARALRSFLRQDPDTIMVGEIRDLETAEIAIKAAQTGHLVLSTLHTNSAPETLERLMNMGIPSYNIASTIRLIMAQRLARKLCDHCKEPLDIPDNALLEAGFAADDIPGLTIYGPTGCKNCFNGYKGRTGIYEIMPISKEMQRLILSSNIALDIAELAKKEGMISLHQSGLLKVKRGETSLDEINRVITV